jgi:hypothetical protein
VENKKKKLFRSKSFSNSGLVSGNSTYERNGDANKQNVNLISNSQSIKKRNGAKDGTDFTPEKHSDSTTNQLILNRTSTSEFNIPSVEYIPGNREAKSQNQLRKIYNIFFKLLDEDRKKIAQKNIHPEVVNYILKYVKDIDASILIKTEDQSSVDDLEKKAESVVNFHRINDIRFINKYFESVNKKLLNGGIFIGCVETFTQRKKRLFKKFPVFLASPYYLFDFIFKRAFPKICFTKKLYYSITHGRSRLLSLPETLGRLVSCGFEIIDYTDIDNLTYFAVRRISEPVYDKTPSYGFLIKLKRVGKNGKIINVFKCRTMHPYSEYLQEYIYLNNSIKKGGKFDNDFRITAWGKILRKYRFDEIPMLLNLFKGDLKLFGVRPLSFQYYNMYEEKIRERRIKYKPGLIPPFFADLPKTFREILDSEKRYLDSFDSHPLKTDWKYFWKVMYNINIKHVMGE